MERPQARVSKKLGEPGRNKSDRDHAYNVWLYQTYGDLLPDSWGNKVKFKSYVKHNPPKLVYDPDEGWTENPRKVKSIGQSNKIRNLRSKTG